MFALLETKLLTLAEALPLEFFVIVASFIEEVVAPIPSPTVMIISGSLAEVQGYTYTGLLALALAGAFGKTVGAVIVYAIADKLEDLIIVRFGRYFDVTRENVAKLGAKLTGKPRDYVLLTLIRAAPFLPSSVVSVGSGLLKVPFRMYLITTFVGTIIRDGVYLYAGYVGLALLKQLLPVFDHVESTVQILAVLVVLGTLGFWYYRARNKRQALQ